MKTHLSFRFEYNGVGVFRHYDALSDHLSNRGLMYGGQHKSPLHRYLKVQPDPEQSPSMAKVVRREWRKPTGKLRFGCLSGEILRDLFGLKYKVYQEQMVALLEHGVRLKVYEVTQPIAMHDTEIMYHVENATPIEEVSTIDQILSI